MKVLCIGDIVGKTGRGMLSKFLPRILEAESIDIIVANGENAAHGRGITKNIYEELCAAEIDVITLGNHTWGCKDVVTLLRFKDNIIRPANFDRSCPGRGCAVIEKNGVKTAVINLIGRTYMNPADSPFTEVDSQLEKHRDADIIIVDFHAEATSEKIAMGWYLDGRVSAVFGTHTHVQTADEMILTKGTGYITDLGMTGPIYSVLGMDRKIVMDRFICGMPQRFELADGKGQFCGAVFEIDELSKKCVGIKRIFEKE